MKQSLASVPQKILNRLALGLLVVFGVYFATYWFLGQNGLILLIVLMITGGFTALILARPEFGLFLIIFSLPFERIPSIDVGGISLKANILFGALTGISILIGLATKQLKLRLTAIHVLALLLLLVYIVSLSQAVELSRALVVVIFTAFVGSFSWLVPQLLIDKKRLITVVRILLVSATIVGVFGMYQFIGDVIGIPHALTGIDPGFSKLVFGFPRIHAFSLEPLYLGNYLLLPLSLLLALLLTGVRTRISRGWLWGLFILLGIVLVLTVSRGAYLAAGVSVVCLAISLPREVLQPKHLLMALGVVGIVGSASYFFLLHSDSTALANFENHVLLGDFAGSGSGEGRVTTYTQAYGEWREHPWLGVGPGNFGAASFGYPDPRVNPDSSIVNNEYLEVLAETGTVGFLVLLTLLGLVLLRSVVALRQASDPFIRAVLIGITAAFIGMLVQYNFFSTLYIIHIWVTIGLLVAIQTLALNPTRSKEVVL
jgi:putative inorganic carbon (HCO3(-)) transporter